jgi:hypothetical protein
MTAMTGKYSAGLKRVRAILLNATTPMTCQEISKAAHISQHLFRNHYVTLLSNEIRVASWRKYQYGWQHEYAAGPGITPPRPKSPPPKVATSAWKERTGYVDPRWAHRRLAKPRDSVLAALLGISKNTTHGANGAGKEQAVA